MCKTETWKQTSKIIYNRLQLLKMIAILAGIITLSSVVALPSLYIDGFAWAENIMFDNSGTYLFVSENTKGELYRISLCNNNTSYCNNVHLSNDFKKFGGLAQSTSGSTIYAGVTFNDGSFGIVTTESTALKGEYQIYFKTKYQPNGMQIDWVHNFLYYTDAGSNSLMAIDMIKNVEYLVKSVDGANGCWLDIESNNLFIGELTNKKVSVFDVSGASGAVFVYEYRGYSSESIAHMMDDITLYSTIDTRNFGSTVLLAGDYQGQQIKQFTLDGTSITTVTPPTYVGALNQITSVRWGKAPSFDTNSIYVSEGGGLTAKTTNRRVFQVTM
jgi:hypothetical protein